MKIIDHKDAINRRLYNNKSFVETTIYRVSCLNRTVLKVFDILHPTIKIAATQTKSAFAD